MKKSHEGSDAKCEYGDCKNKATRLDVIRCTECGEPKSWHFCNDCSNDINDGSGLVLASIEIPTIDISRSSYCGCAAGA